MTDQEPSLTTESTSTATSIKKAKLRRIWDALLQNLSKLLNRPEQEQLSIFQNFLHVNVLDKNAVPTFSHSGGLSD